MLVTGAAVAGFAPHDATVLGRDGCFHRGRWGSSPEAPSAKSQGSDNQEKRKVIVPSVRVT